MSERFSQNLPARSALKSASQRYLVLRISPFPSRRVPLVPGAGSALESARPRLSLLAGFRSTAYSAH